MFAADVNSPVRCPECNAKVVIKKTWSRAYQAVQSTGIIVFLLFLGGYFYGIWGGILALCSLIGCGYFIRGVECSCVRPEQVTAEAKGNGSSRRRFAAILFLVLCLIGFIVFALEINA